MNEKTDEAYLWAVDEHWGMQGPELVSCRIAKETPKTIVLVERPSAYSCMKVLYKNDPRPKQPICRTPKEALDAYVAKCVQQLKRAEEKLENARAAVVKASALRAKHDKE